MREVEEMRITGDTSGRDWLRYIGASFGFRMWLLHGQQWETNCCPSEYGIDVDAKEVIDRLLYEKMYSRLGLLLAGLMTEIEVVKTALYIAELNFNSAANANPAFAQKARAALEVVKEWIESPEKSQEAADTLSQYYMSIYCERGYSKVWSCLRVAFNFARQERKLALAALGEEITRWILESENKRQAIEHIVNL